MQAWMFSKEMNSTCKAERTKQIEKVAKIQGINTLEKLA